MTSTRDHRNWTKGYQEALVDIYAALLRDNEDGVIQWIRDNNNQPEVLEAMLKKHFEDIDDNDTKEN